MKMAIIYRTAGDWGAGKGANLTPAEVDGNFRHLDQRVSGLETNPPTPAAISNIVVSGSQFTIYLDDLRSFGPFSLPMAAFEWRGNWSASADYEVGDLVKVPETGTIYIVRQPHTADDTGSEFSASLQINGEPAYEMMLESSTAYVPSPVEARSLSSGTDEVYVATRAADNGKFLALAVNGNNSTTLAYVITSQAYTGVGEQTDPFQAGDEIYLMQDHSGPISIVSSPEGWVNFNHPPGTALRLNGLGSVVTLKMIAEDEWIVLGDLAPEVP